MKKADYNFWVYILTNWKRTVLYVGMTNDLPRRLCQHFFLRGNPKSFTGKYYCYNLVWYQWHQYVNNAIEQEKALKAGTRAEKEALIMEMNPEWRFLNKEICGEWPPKLPPPDMPT